MGDFSANFHRPDSGINTVEGTLAGGRAAMLEKKRQREQEEYEQKKAELVARGSQATSSVNDKFSSGSTTAQTSKFQQQTVGLVSANKFKELAAAAQNEQAAKKAFLDTTDDDLEEIIEPQQKKKKLLSKKEKKRKLKEKKKLMSTLSFANNDEDEALVEAVVEEESDLSDKKSKKDPTVDTSFLPDKARDLEFVKNKAKLTKEWKLQQQQIQQEPLEITYSYWDGSGHRRQVQVKKGDSIGDFLELVRQSLAKEFRELGSVGADALLYVKEDLILPQDLTFYDLIATKARGKSGPLFHFDVHEDIRTGVIDTRVEKDESHPGKVVARSWYDRNKHIFPASRWEWYDPTKDYGNYTIGDFNKKNKK